MENQLSMDNNGWFMGYDACSELTLNWKPAGLSPWWLSGYRAAHHDAHDVGRLRRCSATIGSNKTMYFHGANCFVGMACFMDGNKYVSETANTKGLSRGWCHWKGWNKNKYYHFINPRNLQKKTQSWVCSEVGGSRFPLLFLFQSQMECNTEG